LTTLLTSNGTIHHTSCTNTPQQKGFTKRKHHHLVEIARSFLLSIDVPSVLWGKVILKPTHFVNQISTSYNSSLAPFEKLYGHAPNYFTLRVFRCTCFVLKPHVERTKLSPKSALCVFLGYGLGQKGYHCFDLVSKKMYVSRHVVFLEHIPFFSIPTNSHYFTTFGVIKIDPYDVDDITPTLVLTLEPILAPITNTPLEAISIDSPTTLA